MHNNDVDFIITWVNPNDEKWIESRNKYIDTEYKEESDNSDARYRDWDTVKYLLRSIEKHTPWVRNVFFVTSGHLPQWLNVYAKGLKIVKHSDFIPKQYLPTFSSHTIELNLHRINGLSQQFVNINDDIIFLQDLNKEYFFKNGLPCDYAILDSLISIRRYSTADIGLTDIEIINDHFVKNAVINKNFFKWFNYHYGLLVMKTVLLLPWKKFSDFTSRHFAVPYLKDTFSDVWEKEYKVLNSTCQHKFRTQRDVNQWLFRYWQLASGKFSPMSPKGNKYFQIRNNNKEMFLTIKNKNCKMICINDVDLHEKINVNRVRNQLIYALDLAFPSKSKYEK